MSFIGLILEPGYFVRYLDSHGNWRELEENTNFSVLLFSVTAYYRLGLQIPNYCQLVQLALLYNWWQNKFLNVQDGGAATDSTRHVLTCLRLNEETAYRFSCRNLFKQKTTRFYAGEKSKKVSNEV
jgi:hypothetical protein